MTDKGCPGERLETLLGQDADRAGCALPSGSGATQKAATLHVRVVCFDFQNRLLSPVAHAGSVAQTAPSVERRTCQNAAVLRDFHSFGGVCHGFELLLFGQHTVRVFSTIALTSGCRVHEQGRFDRCTLFNE